MSDDSASLGEEDGNVEFFDIEKRAIILSHVYKDIIPFRSITGEEFGKHVKKVIRLASDGVNQKKNYI